MNMFSTLKKEYLQKALNFQSAGYQYKVSISKQCFSVEIKEHDKPTCYLVARMGEDFLDHRLIEVSYYFNRKTGRHTVRRNPGECTEYSYAIISKMFPLMKEFWLRYCCEGNTNGIFFVYEEDLLEKDVLAIIEKELPSLTLPAHLQEVMTARQPFLILYANVSDNLETKLMNFEFVLQQWEKLINAFPVLGPHKKIIYRLLSDTVSFPFAGSEFVISAPNGYESLTICEKSSVKEMFLESVPVHDLVPYFEEKKEENSLANLLKTPRDNYTDLLKCIRVKARNIDILMTEKDRDYQARLSQFINDGFEELEEKLGGWEEVENECAFMFEQIQENSVKLFHNLYNKTISQSLKIYHFEGKRGHYYFMIRKKGAVGEIEDFRIHFSQDFHPEPVINVIQEFALEGVFSQE